MKILGIDEAGRGPVIGPLVMAAVLIDEEKEQNLVNMGVKDSKFLTPKQRDDLFDRIKIYEHKIIIIPPKKVDEALSSKKSNLNWLEGDTAAQLINDLKPGRAILDCPSSNVRAFSDFVKSKINIEVDLVAEHKADELYPVVSAASILAKVIRDREIEKLKKKHRVDFGSGYPSDPKTIEFLQENYDKYDFFRKEWASYKNVAEGKKQKSLDSF